MNTKPYLVISASLFGVIAVLHLLRVILSVPANIGGTSLPVGLSWGGLVVAATLSAWGFRLLENRAV